MEMGSHEEGYFSNPNNFKTDFISWPGRQFHWTRWRSSTSDVAGQGRRQEPHKLHQVRPVPWSDHSRDVCLSVAGLMQSLVQTAPSQHWCWYPLCTGWGEEAWRAEVTLPNPRDSQEPAVSAVPSLRSRGQTLLKLVNHVAVSAGTWKCKWRKRWKSISWKVANQLFWPDNRASLCSGRSVPSSAVSVLAHGCHRGQLLFIVRKMPLCLLCLLVADSVGIA